MEAIQFKLQKKHKNNFLEEIFVMIDVSIVFLTFYSIN